MRRAGTENQSTNRHQHRRAVKKLPAEQQVINSSTACDEYNELKQQQQQHEEEKEEQRQEEDNVWIITKDDSKLQSRDKIKESFRRNKVVMTVTQKDILPGDEFADDTDLCKGFLRLPRTKEDYGTNQVTNCCVICLESYQPGDLVVWSSNTDCQHAFHRSCSIKYLIRIQKRVAMTPCCICRCHFTDLEVEEREKHYRRRGRGGRRTVRTRNIFELSMILPLWIYKRRHLDDEDPRCHADDDEIS